MATSSRVGQLLQLTDVTLTAASFAVFFMQAVASPACSCWSSQLAAVYHDGRHRCACASTETRIGLSNLVQFDLLRTAGGRPPQFLEFRFRRR